MPRPGAEIPQGWTIIEPSTELVGRMNRRDGSGLHVFGPHPQDILAVRQAGDDYFMGDPTAQAITLLSWRIAVPRPGAPGIKADVIALREGMRSIGFRMRKYGGVLRFAGISPQEVVLGGELPSPVEVLERNAVLLTREPEAPTDHSEGLGFVTLRAMEPDELVVGWCAPWSGLSCAVPVVTASIPGPTRTFQTSPGGGTGRL